MNDLLITLDAHAHIAAIHPADSLVDSGFVLGMTLTIGEAETVFKRADAHIAWGVGCYPRKSEAQETFDKDVFRSLVERTAIVGEVGLDTGSRVPIERQQKNFRQVLDIVLDFPRFTSIHSYRATGLVLEELRKRPITTPVLHWWTGSADETTRAVELGCYFSIHSAVARHTKFRTRVPPERILVESDHGYGDPPAAIPCRVEWVEHLVAQQLGFSVGEVRRLAWQNFGRIIADTGTLELLPVAFREMLSGQRGCS